ncbi:MAG: hypothetical protein ACRC3H_24320 [Lachnospiraceae bacterium]
MTKHDVMNQYFTGMVEDIEASTPGFNFADNREGAIGFITEYSNKIKKKYIRGADKEYGFMCLFTQLYSSSTDDVNLQAMNKAQKIIDWLDAQDAKKNYPDFGERCQVKKIEVTQNIPELASADWENQIAQYAVHCKVTYFEK